MWRVKGGGGKGNNEEEKKGGNGLITPRLMEGGHSTRPTMPVVHWKKNDDENRLIFFVKKNWGFQIVLIDKDARGSSPLSIERIFFMTMESY